MNALKRKRIIAVIKYTWPIYIVSAVILTLLMNFIFQVTHRLPPYKSITLFISGEVTDSKKLKNDLIEKYKDKEIKSVETISAYADEAVYHSKLTVTGVSSADILIIPKTKLNDLKISTFGLELNDEILSSYFSGLATYSQEEKIYGIKLNKEIIEPYFKTSNDEHYMILNAGSANIGKYSASEIKEHDVALELVKEWGI